MNAYASRHSFSLFLALGFLLSALLPAHAYAIGNAGGPLCSVIGQIIGPTGRAIATIAIIALGIGAMFGKISWLSALVVATGIAIVFSAASIIGLLIIQGGAHQCPCGLVWNAVSGQCL